jgi:hypothetical protein
MFLSALSMSLVAGVHGVFGVKTSLPSFECPATKLITISLACLLSSGGFLVQIPCDEKMVKTKLLLEMQFQHKNNENVMEPKKF